ncbi:MAG TPA: hypothetical protein VF395_21000, partial [Polyangiaceae bacterium]
MATKFSAERSDALEAPRRGLSPSRALLRSVLVPLVLLLVGGCELLSGVNDLRGVGIDASTSGGSGGNGGQLDASLHPLPLRDGSAGRTTLPDVFAVRPEGGNRALADAGNGGTGGAPRSGSGGAADVAADIADAAVHPDSTVDSGASHLVGDPLWYGTGADVYKGLDDPRWGGAAITSFANDPVGTAAGYRLLVNGSVLNISFEALAPPGGAPTGADLVYLGITTNSGGT